MLDYDFQIQAEDSLQVLKLILQPLVENGIQHGIIPKMKPGIIHIRVTQQDENLVMEVEDDGVGMKEEQLGQLREELKKGTAKKSYGLINVNNRIRLLYGETSGISIDSREGNGTCVRIFLTGLQDKKMEELNG